MYLTLNLGRESANESLLEIKVISSRLLLKYLSIFTARHSKTEILLHIFISL